MKKIICKKNIILTISITMFFLMWYILYKIENHEVIIPSIQNTFSEVINITTSDDFFNIVLTTTIRVIIGFTISLFLGFIFGFIAGLNKTFEYLMKPYILVMRSTPIVAIMLIALIWFKSNNVPILVNFLLCFPIIYESVMAGVRNTDKSILEFAKVHKISKLTTITDIYLPSIFLYVISSVFNTISLSWKTTVSSEIISLPKYGIGNSIYTSKVYLNTAEVFAWLIIIILISFICDLLINLLKNNVLKKIQHKEVDNTCQ